jgi:trehalose/maltose hydrolase-like predicted phosphorylase
MLETVFTAQVALPCSGGVTCLTGMAASDSFEVATNGNAPISPAAVREYRPEFIPAYLSNGVIGLRAGRVPFLEGLAIASGFAGRDPEMHVESFARAPFPLSCDIKIGDGELNRSLERVTLREQRYDFSCGELLTAFEFDGGNARAQVEVVTLCSRTQPTICMQEVRLEVDRACDVEMKAGIDPTGVPGGMVSRRTHSQAPKEVTTDGSLRWESNGGISECGAAYGTEFTGADARRSFDEDDHAALETSYAFRARAGRSYRLRQVTSLVPDTLHGECDVQAIRLVCAARSLGFQELRRANRLAWEEIWRGRINLVGAPSRWQALADAAFFYLHSSVHRSSPASTSLFGLAYWPNYHYYRGHVMWDIETFAFPPLLLTDPEAARSLLDFRFRGLNAAMKNAKMSGYRGAQFPWESSLRHGEEASPGDGTASAHEHHVSLDVAFAFIQHVHATGDLEYARERAWPVLRGVADWVASRVVKTRRGFEIHRANGIAEKKEPVNNNAFVNMAAKVVMREIVALAPQVGQHADDRWSQIADGMFIPLNTRTKVIKNHDAYRPNEEKGSTPEAPAGIFPLGYDAPPDVERATFEYYLRLADDYVGSPMLSALLGVYAARTGDRGRSLELFERGYADFIMEPFAQTTEYSPKVFPDETRAGPFAANIGGFLTSLLFGLAGLKLSSGDTSSWCTHAVTMPRGWDGIEVEQIHARGETARLVATHGANHAELR